MKKLIDSKIIEETTKCRFNFQCLDEGGKPQCEVENFIAKNIIFVKRPSGLKCGYNLRYRSSYMCKCPTRVALYRKYKI